MKIYTYQNILSPHQVAIFDSVAELGFDVTLITIEELSEDRARMGWKPVYPKNCELKICSKVREIVKIIRESHPDSTHFFCGIRTNYFLAILLSLVCVFSDKKFVYVSEAPDLRGWKSTLRFIKYRFEYILVGKYVTAIFCIGDRAREWFTQVGYSRKRLCDFAYVSGRSSAAVSRGTNLASTRTIPYPHIGLVGRLDYDKGADILLDAFVNTEQLQITIVGDGPQRRMLEKKIEQNDAIDRVRLTGYLEYDEVRTIMESFDLLVLPSRKEGWGAVVNEAIELGVGVVCSDACGSACIAGERSGVSTFESEDVLALKLEVLRRLKDLEHYSKDNIIKYSEYLTDKNIAKYIVDSVRMLAIGGLPSRANWITGR